MRKKQSVEERWLAKIDEDGPEIIETPCWNWKGSLNSQGYGQFVLDGKIWAAHRAGWKILHGQIRNGEFCLWHRCGNKRCVNPDHLSLERKLKMLKIRNGSTDSD